MCGPLSHPGSNRQHAPIKAYTDAPLPSAAERPCKKGARNKRNPPCCERPIEKVAGASQGGYPRPQRRTMGLTGVGGRQQDGESKRTRTALSVHVDNMLKDMGMLRRGGIYVLCFESTCLLTGDTKGTQRRKRGQY